ncbi:methylmalonyl-CoA mutase family protein [Yimella sp. cx-51]|uniref:methylmalonyl-CoA mutase family protein n=1 Tax=Yimella sp. cx-51 TaxID=2770551 RepID=UPI00165E1822|nr:methylmalonyl-CoA mutase family protein [Yimella sp. cx-51]MBC9956167.1 methylmalonyl-CoA mutase small subunit [Yimella sp. cx-51]QTH38678.1 methylmalonyl-CoA mutase small subunit [Yimella sp. cx-51]
MSDHLDGPESDLDPTQTTGAESDVLTLADGFPVLDHARWQHMAAAVLNRGRPDDKKLSGEQAQKRLRVTTPDGLEIDALYSAPADGRALGHPGVMPFVRGSSVRTGDSDAWQIRQWHDDPDPAASAKAVLADLQGGAHAVWMQLGADGITVDDLPTVLDGVHLEMAALHVSTADDQIAAARAAVDLWESKELEGFTVRGGLGIDRLGAIARGNAEPEKRDVLRLVRTCVGTYPTVRSLTVDATIYHEAGAGAVEEVACAIATGVAYLRGLEQSGVTAAQTYSQIEFRVAAEADQFITIAKLRALRRLWARVGEVCGVPDVLRGARQHAVTSRRMMTRIDPSVNMLRATTACFAAAVGGAEAITVLPYDTAWGLPDATSRRIARNTQIVLAEESHLGRVTDAAGGSWYVESLTDQLAVKAWEFFQQLDADGGMENALRDGRVADRIAAVRGERESRLDRRSQPITGVSMFPPASQPPLERAPHPSIDLVAEPAVTPVRDAEVFEALRERRGEGSKVFLACIGARRDFGARESFTSNLLRIAGLEPVVAEGISAEELTAAMRAADSDIVILCSSPAKYAELGNEVAAALRDAGARKVLIAGRARELASDAATQIDGEIYDGMDVVAFLGDLLDTLGAPR